MKVAIQGVKGSYHHQVADLLYGEVELLECSTFDQLSRAVAQGDVDKGVMAIGNSIAGSILPNYTLISENGLNITAECYLDIDHQLMALKGQSLDDIVEVQSHPMALLQCKPFFRDYPEIKLVETDDTAAAAYRIQRDGKKGIAAIASSIAATIYDLDIIASDIQEIKNNATRFVVVEKEQEDQQEPNKATINFVSSHEAGSLARILTIFGAQRINLTKIQSIPIVDKPFLFSFVADLEFEALDQFTKARQQIQPYIKELTVLGIYKSATL
ncbi:MULTISPECIES: prephenate dehydratase [Nonlabens]|uniref:prephenate dehydratase n=1 Tax=Nonlabens agnitus TaxID=870484 RepID=A0A2S9WVE7_9FLAO|nr:MULTISPECIES: prephenate dehydratase [Nonlabens]KQC31955.1 prephenate dehydratase [Nonlabens sp. YIK11]PRP67346.1 prephenate dehydratase [Nonlabens agnitus]